MSDPSKKQKIIELYKDPQFAGSFSGAKAFYNSLKKENDFPSVSYQDVLKTLSAIPSYSLHVRKHKLRFYRHVDYDKLSVGVDMQADLAEFPETAEGTKYAFIMIDVMDNYCYAKELPDKTAKSVREAFLSLTKKHRLNAIETLATDQGGEFKANRKFFEQQKIKLIFLGRDTKAFKVIPCLML